MQEFDNDKRSARFTLVTSIVGTWMVAAITAGVGQFLSNQFLLYRVPLWSVLLLGLVGLSAAGVAMRQIWKGRRSEAWRREGRSLEQSREVFLILCAFDEKRWLAGLIRDLHDALDRFQFDLVLKIPEHDYVYFGQARHLQSLRERPGAYAGGIISPAEPRLLRPELETFCASVGYPIIFVDAFPFDEMQDRPAGTAFVGYPAEVIGRIAADYVVEHSVRRCNFSPDVLVVGSAKLHEGRQVGFAERLKQRLRDAKITVKSNGDFSRERAHRIVYESLQSEQRIVPDYIFCINDEMALGAVDALRLWNLGDDGSVVVIGVDGIPEVKVLIDSQKTPLRATVVQDSRLMADTAASLLVKAIRGEPVENKYLDPEIYSKDR